MKTAFHCSICLLAVMWVMCLACSSPTVSRASRKVYFRNLTYTAYRVVTQNERLGLPVESRVMPGDSLDVCLVSLESRDRISAGLFPESMQGSGYRFSDIDLDIQFDKEGGSVKVMQLGEGGVAVTSQTMAIPNEPADRLVIEAREQQDSLRVFVENTVDTTISVQVVVRNTVDTTAIFDSNTTMVEKGLFPVSNLMASDSTRSIRLVIADLPQQQLPLEKDILLKVVDGAQDSLQVYREFDMPPNLRTSTPVPRYRVLTE